MAGVRGIIGFSCGMVLATVPLALSLRRLLLLRDGFPLHPAAFAKLYRGAPEAIRMRTTELSFLLADTPLGPLAAALAVEVASARVAAVDEALADLEPALAARPADNAAYLRVFAFGGLLCCLVGFLEGAAFVEVLPLVVLAFCGGAAFFVVTREWDVQRRELCEALDAWVDAAFPSGAARSGPPARRTSRGGGGCEEPDNGGPR